MIDQSSVMWERRRRDPPNPCQRRSNILKITDTVPLWGRP